MLSVRVYEEVQVLAELVSAWMPAYLSCWARIEP